MDDTLGAVFANMTAPNPTGMPMIPAGPTELPIGQISPGNLPLALRPQVRNPDGSVSTVRSLGFNMGAGEVLAPTVIGNQVVSNQDAMRHYRQTGENLGTFDTVADSDAYAQSLHHAQARFYGRGR